MPRITPGIWACGALVALGACTKAPADAPPPDAPPPTVDPGPTPPPPPPPFEAGPGVLPRLTATQYRRSLEAAFGPALPDGLPRVELEPDTNPYLFFSIGAASTTLSETGAQRYADAAEAIAAELDLSPAVLGCAPSAPSDPCVQRYLTGLARRLFRRVVTEAELTPWFVVAREAADGDAQEGLRAAIFGMLQSPWFLYRVELGEPDPADPARQRYTSEAMASRLAFLLWNQAPDEALLDAGAAGELVTDAGLEAAARRLLADPRAAAAVQDFFAQYLDLGRLDHVERDPARYPGFTPGLLTAMRTEVRLLVQDLVFRREADVRELFRTRRTFVNPALAELYEVPAPGATPVTFVPVELPADGPRAGVLTLGAFLTMNAHPTDTSPTLRGKYVRERLLCQSVPPPPDNVDTRLVPSEGEPKTLRERLEQHRSDPSCQTCHSFIDPPGFLFEKFDSIGRFRETFEGIPLDTSGDLDGEPLADARGLAEALARDPRVPDCLAQQLYRHAVGRLDTRGERRALIDLQADFRRSGYRFTELLVALVKSEGFRTLEATP